MTGLSQLEFVRYLVPDFNGTLRCKLFPCKGDDFEPEAFPICVLTLTHNGIPLEIKDHLLAGFGNLEMRPIPSTLVERSWDYHRRKAKVGQVFCELHDQTGEPTKEDVRRIARRQVDRLAEKGLIIYSGVECEFCVYKTDQHGESNEPYHQDNRVFVTDHLDLYEEFMVDIESRLRQCGMTMYSMHSAKGPGQLEISLSPSQGIDYGDHGVIFKSLVKETAKEHKMVASFMTSQKLNDYSPNGAHFNHSLWRKNSSNELENIFHDPINKLGISQECEHWLAGILHHAPALTALCCPTVNCYRRIGLAFSPEKVDWSMTDRESTFRVKCGSDKKRTLVENRLPSSAANPYLVLAGTIAAGLNGLEKKMTLPDQHDKSASTLPRNLKDALDALSADSIICEALGERFIEWYVFQKSEETKYIKGMDPEAVPTESEEISTERDHFFLYA